MMRISELEIGIRGPAFDDVAQPGDDGRRQRPGAIVTENLVNALLRPVSQCLFTFGVPCVEIVTAQQVGVVIDAESLGGVIG